MARTKSKNEKLQGVGYYLKKFLDERKKSPVEKTAKSKLIFRGQANKDWLINSSAGRRLSDEGKETQDEFIRYHENLIENAKNMGYGKLEDDKELTDLHDLEILSLIQHQGGATGLTDFTTNFLVALWMATEPKYKTVNDGNKEYKEEIKANGKVIWLDLFQNDNFNRISYYNKFKPGDTIRKLLTIHNPLWELERKFEPRFWLWEPTKLSNRIKRQNSVFMFGLAPFNNKTINYHELEVEYSHKQRIQKELDEIFGINTETIYYDLAGYAGIFNGTNSKISEKILSNEICIENAKEYIKKEKFELAVSYINQALDCQITTDDKKNGICGKSCENKCKNNVAELFYRRGKAMLHLKRTEEALYSFESAVDKFKLLPFESPICIDNNHRMYCGTLRYLIAIYCEKKNFATSIKYNELLYDQFCNAENDKNGGGAETNNLDEINGVDSILDMIELAIITHKKDVYVKYLEKVKDYESYIKEGNGVFIYDSLLLIGGHIFENKVINGGDFKDQAERKYKELLINDSLTKDLIGNFYWVYTDLKNWVKEPMEYKKLVAETRYEIESVLDCCEEMQKRLMNYSLKKFYAVNKPHKNQLEK